MLLEKIFLFAMVVAKEGDGVGHHPDVSTATVVVRFMPLTILLGDGCYCYWEMGVIKGNFS